MKAFEIMEKKHEIAVFGGGCFWCTETLFERLKGVISVKSGYAGGSVENPSYEQVSGGKTGHAEVIQIKYNPAEVSYEILLDVFFSTHDPTTFNRQGMDIGAQYRSIILYTSPSQKKVSETYIQKLTADKVFDKPIVTQVQPLDKFYEAEAYHQEYYRNNPNKPYCMVIISPKVSKLRQKFAHLLK